jgi:hypothetical protein
MPTVPANTARSAQRSHNQARDGIISKAAGASSSGKPDLAAAQSAGGGRGPQKSSGSSATGAVEKNSCALWWDVSDESCDLCGGGCDSGQVQLCEVCEVAQYCSDKCYKAAVAAGKHHWAACRALGAVKSGGWRSVW